MAAIAKNQTFNLPLAVVSPHKGACVPELDCGDPPSPLAPLELDYEDEEFPSLFRRFRRCVSEPAPRIPSSEEMSAFGSTNAASETEANSTSSQKSEEAPVEERPRWADEAVSEAGEEWGRVITAEGTTWPPLVSAEAPWSQMQQTGVYPSNDWQDVTPVGQQRVERGHQWMPAPGPAWADAEDSAEEQLPYMPYMPSVVGFVPVPYNPNVMYNDMYNGNGNGYHGEPASHAEVRKGAKKSAKGPAQAHTASEKDGGKGGKGKTVEEDGKGAGKDHRRRRGVPSLVDLAKQAKDSGDPRVDAQLMNEVAQRLSGVPGHRPCGLFLPSPTVAQTGGGYQGRNCKSLDVLPAMFSEPAQGGGYQGRNCKTLDVLPAMFSEPAQGSKTGRGETCPSCAHPMAASFKFCTSCGHRRGA